MVRTFRAIWILLITATTLFIALSGFTLLNFDNIIVARDKAAMMDMACGTSSFANNPEPQLDLAAAAGKIVFEANCKACHRMQQQIVGPPLKGIFARRDSVWIRKWIQNSAKVVASGDPYAVNLFREFNGTPMTAFTTMRKEDLDALMAYMKFSDAH